MEEKTNPKYPESFEGVVDIQKIIDERDELDRLLGQELDRVFKLEQTVENLYKILGMIGDVGVCKGCGQNIIWIKNPKSGKLMPISTANGVNHFADCPKADQFKKGGGK